MIIKIYLVVGFLICGLFLWATFEGVRILDPGSVTASRPTGGTHFHK